jgi:hypothetical protein
VLFNGMRLKGIAFRRGGPLFIAAAVLGGPFLAEQLSSSANGQALPQPALIPYFVSWEIHAQGSAQQAQGSGNLKDHESIWRFKADAAGSAITRFRQYPGSEKLYFQDTHYLTFTQHLDRHEWLVFTYPNRVCTLHNWFTMADSGSYAGYRAVNPTPAALLEFPPELRGGVRVMRRPFAFLTINSFVPIPLFARFQHEAYGTASDQAAPCSGYESRTAQENAVRGLWDSDDPKLDLQADPANPSSFLLHARFTRAHAYGDGRDVQVEFSARAYPMGKCAQRDGPIPENDPVVEDVNVHIDTDDAEITPQGKTKVRIRVTCEGVPVDAANVKIEVEPVDSSGAHIHTNDRPKGKLDGKDLTSANPSITRTTDKNGTVKGPAGITFSPPGKAPASRCLGIAGDYKVTATSEKFKDSMDKAVILVRFKNLTMLPKAENYDICADSVHGCNKDGPWGTSDHPESEYGTAGTIQAFQAVGTEFWNVEQSHNQYLHACNAKPWPMRKVSFNDIALPWGGLFDMDSTWTYPHRTHGKGQGGDFNHFHETCDAGPCLSCGGASVNLNTYLWSVLKSTGEQHGRWDSEVNSTGELHLHVEDQGQGPPASCPADN